MNGSGEFGRRAALTAMAAGFVAVAAGARAADGIQDANSPDAWPELAPQIFNKRQILDGSTLLAIEAPYRAEDAAVVPLSVHTTLPAGDARVAHAITLVIDANPSPLAAVFTLGGASGTSRIATRVRVNDYTNIHAVVELSDGKLYGTKRFVKAAGGCSAPALTMTADAIPLGTMKFRLFAAAAGGLPEAQLMIRHPNYNGMQMDQVTRLYIPADFVQTIRVSQGDDLLLAADSGISISENPSFRFNYKPNGAKQFRVEAKDNKGGVYKHDFPASVGA